MEKQRSFSMIFGWGFYGVVKKMTFLKKSFCSTNNIVVDVMSTNVILMDHCNPNFTLLQISPYTKY